MLKKLILKIKLPDKNPIQAIVSVFYNNIFRINKFFIYELNLKENIEFTIKNHNFEIKIIDHNQLKYYLPKDQVRLPREFYMHEIHGVKNCVVVLDNNKIAHISWIYRKGDPNRWFKLKENEASISYSYTLKEYRGKSLFPNALLSAAIWLKNEKCIRILEAPNVNTIYTLRSFQKIKNLKNISTLTQWSFYRPKYRTKHN